MKAITKRKWMALGTALVIVIAAALTTAFVVNRGSEPGDYPMMVAPSTEKTTTTTVKPTTTTKAEPLPIPAAPPTDAYANVPVVQIGTIEIPKIGLVHPIYEGIQLTVIDHGPGHWPGSAMPGKTGNTVFPGHRVTHSHPFLNVDLLAPGDQVVFHMPGEDSIYKVTGTQIVVPTDLWVIDQTPKPTFTLIACHPKHSAAQRIVIKGDFVSKHKTTFKL
jgi:sortase A